MIEALIFDWGDTVMRDFDLPGPMSEWPNVDWIPGVEESLQMLSQKFTCIIATSAAHSSKVDMINALKRVGADRYFLYFFSQKELGFKKPQPQFFEQTALLSGFKPKQCIMIGNLYDKDIVGAHQVGMKTILFDESNSGLDFPLADQIIADMKFLPEAVMKIQSIG